MGKTSQRMGREWGEGVGERMRFRDLSFCLGRELSYVAPTGGQSVLVGAECLGLPPSQRRN